MGEELGARGEREGNASEKEEGAGEDLPRRARHPPAPWRSRSARGALHLRVPGIGLAPALSLPSVLTRRIEVPLRGRRSSGETQVPGALDPFCHILPYRPR